MKHLLLSLIFPSQEAVARWGNTRRHGLARFIVVNGVMWLGFGLLLLALLDVLNVSELFVSLVNAVRVAPLKSGGLLLGISVGFGLVLCLINELAYRIACKHAEP